MSSSIQPSSPQSSKLRIGLLVDSLTQPAWVREMLRRVAATGIAEVVLVVRNAYIEPPRSTLARMWDNFHTLGYSLHLRLDRKLFAPKHDPFETGSIEELIPDAKVFDVVPQRGKHVDRLAAVDVDRIAAERPDVLIRLGFRILKGPILTLAPAGVWSFHHGDPDTHRGGPAGYWEVFRGEPTTGAILQILNEELDGGTILAETHSCTDPTSQLRNNATSYWKALAMLPRQLKSLARLGADEFLGQAGTRAAPVRFYSHKLYVARAIATSWPVFSKPLDA
ncbi:MAG: hypothetical protein QM811_05815 [Pirellulales bacterium]